MMPHLTCSFLEHLKVNMKDFLSKILKEERNVWEGVHCPEQDVDGAYHTTVGTSLFQMIDSQLNVSKFISVYISSGVEQ